MLIGPLGTNSARGLIPCRPCLRLGRRIAEIKQSATLRVCTPKRSSVELRRKNSCKKECCRSIFLYQPHGQQCNGWLTRLASGDWQADKSLYHQPTCSMQGSSAQPLVPGHALLFLLPAPNIPKPAQTLSSCQRRCQMC